MKKREHQSNSLKAKPYAQVILFIAIVLLLDQSIGKICQHYYFKQKSGDLFQTTYAIDSTTADIIILGTSRANHHYIPNMIEDSLKLSTYNAGKDGINVLYDLAILEAITNRHSPKIVILDIGPMELFYDQRFYDKLGCLLPYYSDHPEIKEIINTLRPHERIKLISAIYPFNSNAPFILMGYLDLFNKNNKDLKGYKPIFGEMKSIHLKTTKLSRSIIDTNCTDAIRKISMICKEKGTRLIIVQSPFYGLIHDDLNKETLQKIANQENDEYIDLMNNKYFLDHPELFKDPLHLNNEGANMFSEMLISRIKANDQRMSQN